jgi:hypothetical protein
MRGRAVYCMQGYCNASSACQCQEGWQHEREWWKVDNCSVPSVTRRIVLYVAAALHGLLLVGAVIRLGCIQARRTIIFKSLVKRNTLARRQRTLKQCCSARCWSPCSRGPDCAQAPSCIVLWSVLQCHHTVDVLDRPSLVQGAKLWTWVDALLLGCSFFVTTVVVAMLLELLARGLVRRAMPNLVLSPGHAVASGFARCSLARSFVSFTLCFSLSLSFVFFLYSSNPV